MGDPYDEIEAIEAAWLARSAMSELGKSELGKSIGVALHPIINAYVEAIESSTTAITNALESMIQAGVITPPTVRIPDKPFPMRRQMRHGPYGGQAYARSGRKRY